jgi:3-oxoacyl-[acyl-carrier-protein] synthase-3
MIKKALPGFLANMQSYQSPASRIVGIGAYLPSRQVDNHELAAMLNAPPDVKKKLPKMIDRVTGIKTRRYAAHGTSPSDLACEATTLAIQSAGIGLSEIDTLIFASTDLDTIEPATANIVQKKLGIELVNAFDVSNACNSFLQGMNVANSLLATGAAQRVLVTSGEIGSYACNRELNSLRELDVKMGGFTLGDAGAAVIMERATGSAGLLEINLMSLGEHWEVCHVPETTDWRQREGGLIHGWFYLDMPALAKIALEATVGYFSDYSAYRSDVHQEQAFMESLAQVVPHQISRRFIEDIGRAVLPLGAFSDFKRVCITADIYGNTASTAIPVAMVKLINDGVIEFGSGQEIFLYGAASGFGIGHIRMRL